MSRKFQRAYDGIRLLSAATLILLMCNVFCGCGVEKTDGNKVRDLEYNIVEEGDIPEELRAKIEEKKAADFKLVFENDEYLYIIRGYGEQETGGYSIQIEEFYLTKNAVVLKTNLMGPTKDEIRNTAPSYPYIVLRTEKTDQNVIFE